jgi:hypothetical protein
MRFSSHAIFPHKHTNKRISLRQGIYVEFFSRLPLPVGKNCIVSIEPYYSMFLSCNTLWTEESVIPSGQTALWGGAFGRISDLVSALLDEMLLATSAEIKSVFLPILTAPATYSEA